MIDRSTLIARSQAYICKKCHWCELNWGYVMGVRGHHTTDVRLPDSRDLQPPNLRTYIAGWPSTAADPQRMMGEEEIA